MKYFSISTINSSGLGDQLGTQFIRLYKLGLAIGLNFIWKDIFFPRSIKPDWYEKKHIHFFRIRYYLLKYFGCNSNIVSSGINAILLKKENKLEKRLWQEKDDLSEFLNLKSLSKCNYVGKFHDVILDSFLLNNKHFTKKELYNFIYSEVQGEEPRLCWTSKCWELIPDIDEFLNKEGYNDLDDGLLSECTRFDKIDRCTVFHIRCGDSTKIHLNNKDLIIYDKFLYTREEEMSSIYAIDSHRKSILPEEYLNPVLDYVAKGEKVFIISDGFDLTFQNLFRNLLKRKCKVKLNREEIKQLLHKADTRNEVFRQFVGAEMIIGENENNLKRSITVISSADSIIWGIGGFALTIHKLFGINRDCNIKNINELP